MGGVCSGIAAYFNIDVVWVRLAFVLLVFVTGVWLFAWLAMLIVMPAARTPEQIASARGEALHAREVMDIAEPNRPTWARRLPRACAMPSATCARLSARAADLSPGDRAWVGPGSVVRPAVRRCVPAVGLVA